MMTKFYSRVMSRLIRLKHKKAQTLVEYALLLGLIALAVVAILTLLGSQLQTVFGKITATLTTASGS
jgi:pilus assembly protein Flp/PilA